MATAAIATASRIPTRPSSVCHRRRAASSRCRSLTAGSLMGTSVDVSAVPWSAAEIARIFPPDRGLLGAVTGEHRGGVARRPQPHTNPTDHRETGGNGGNRREHKLPAQKPFLLVCPGQRIGPIFPDAEEVRGSNPLAPTREPPRNRGFLAIGVGQETNRIVNGYW